MSPTESTQIRSSDLEPGLTWRVALLFPGQGSQHSGAIAALPDHP
jgi:hypothetical protein